MNGSTYFIQPRDGGLIKIGFSKSPKERLKILQIGSPVPLVIIATIDGNVEYKLHWMFKRHRRHGEWFDPTPELFAFIRRRARKTSYWREAADRSSNDHTHTDTLNACDVRRTDDCPECIAAEQRRVSNERWGENHRAFVARMRGGIANGKQYACACNVPYVQAGYRPQRCCAAKDLL